MTVTENETAPISEEQQKFEEMRDQIAEKLKDDLVFRKTIAEIYIFQSQLDQAIRSVIANGGPMAMLKAVIKGK